MFDGNRHGRQEMDPNLIIALRWSESLEAKLNEAVALLKRLEWVQAPATDGLYCPSCGHHEAWGHEASSEPVPTGGHWRGPETCELAKFLRENGEAK